MHALVIAVHEDPVFDETGFSKFCWDNPDYFQRTYHTSSLEETKDALVKFREQAQKQIEERSKQWYKNALETLDSLKTDREKLEFLANFYCYELDDEGRMYEETNPWAFCDWFVIGGRWENILQDCFGETSNTVKLSDFFGFNSEIINAPYGIVSDFLDGEFLEEVSDEGWADFLDEIRDYSCNNEVDLYLTAVDIHM